jgi:hypothetical protein
MPNFSGSLSLAQDPANAVRADINVVDNRLTIQAAGDSLGDWPLAEIVIVPADSGFRVRADGEDLLLTTGDDHAFAEAVGVPPPQPQDNGAKATPARTKKTSKRFAIPRQRKVKRPQTWVNEETLRDEVAYALFGAAVLLLIGAALPWGETRLVDGDGFPWARALTVLAALTAGVGAFIAWRQGQRITGTAVAAGACFVALLVLYFYANAAGVGIGFVVAMLAIMPLAAAAGLGLSRWGEPPR